jgi:hypothetical protein
MFFSPRFNHQKCKAQLKMATIRIAQQTNKKTQLMKIQKRNIAQLLTDGKEEKARIKTEAIIREDFVIEAYEVLSLLCDLLYERMPLIQSLKLCPPDLRESVCTLIYAAARTEIPELMEARKMFTIKYGKEFAESALMNENNVVNNRVVHKLGITPPNTFLILQYMKVIAKAHDVEWDPKEENVSEADLAAPMPAPSGFTVQAGVGGGMQGVYGQFSQPEGVTGSSPAASQPAPDRVQCGQCGAILAVPANAPRFACPNCGALLASPNVPQVAKAVLPVADIKIIPNDDNGTNKGGDDNSGGGSGGDHSLPSPPAEVPRDIPPPPGEEDEKAQFLRQDAKDNEKKGEDSVEDDGAPSLDSLAARFARLKD